MNREITLIVLGLLTMVTPYTGFPSAWRTGILVVLGAAVAIVGFMLRGEALAKPHERRESEHHPFQESTGPSMSDIRSNETLPAH